eukprot:14968-Heterococcus_DN1.PRE.2
MEQATTVSKLKHVIAVRFLAYELNNKLSPKPLAKSASPANAAGRAAFITAARFVKASLARTAALGRATPNPKQVEIVHSNAIADSKRMMLGTAIPTHPA